MKNVNVRLSNKNMIGGNMWTNSRLPNDKACYVKKTGIHSQGPESDIQCSEITGIVEEKLKYENQVHPI